MNKKLIVIFLFIAFTSVLACVFICVLTGGCCDKEVPKSYYMYDYYSGDFLVMKNAVVVEHTVLNDSVSLLDITNHLRRGKGRECRLTYAAVIYQKKNKQGISYSEDGVNYHLYYSHNILSSKFPFPIFGFFGFDCPENIEFKEYLSLFGNKYKIYSEDFHQNTIIFSENVDLPVFGKRNMEKTFYQLSKVVSKRREINFNFIEKVRHEASFFSGKINQEEPSIDKCYIELLEKALDMKKKGLSSKYIFEITGITYDELLMYEDGVVAGGFF